MEKSDLGTATLDALQTSEQQNLLDEIDGLRRQGISDFVYLPQIVVCGDQSSGKSSVLEAISGVPFPRNDTLCTRFATEVILRQTTNVEASVSIVPSQDVTDAERSKLLKFGAKLQNIAEFPSIVESAKVEMGTSSSGSAFSKNILRVEISGPRKPKLTVVDLPGLIHSESKQQSAADVEIVADLVNFWTKNPRSIILAVVSAKNDYANQIILKKAKRVDPQGLRTLGLITKPDTLPKGSDSEADFVNLASNDNICFRLGWHVVRNRDYETRNTTSEERDRAEERFFSQGVWAEMSQSMLGVRSLRQRLSNILLNQIKTYLPGLMKDIKTNISECKQKLHKLGDSRDTNDKQRQFLLKLSQTFQDLCKAAVDGSYEHLFFGDPSSDAEYTKRLRAVVQNLNLAFSERMRRKGHHRTILSEGEEAPKDEPQRNPTRALEMITMTRAEALDWVRQRLVRARGRELPGSHNPMLVGEFFRDQSMNWERISRGHVRKVWFASNKLLETVLGSIADGVTCNTLLTHWIDPKSKERLLQANEALDRLQSDKQRQPITYNHYYTENLQKVRANRQKEIFEDKIKHFFGTGSDSIQPNFQKTFSVAALTKTLIPQSEADMDSFACSELLDSMQAYYKVGHSLYKLSLACRHQYHAH